MCEEAWSAGFFDGEGSFTFKRVRDNIYPVISISQSDREVLDKFKEFVQVGKVYGPYIQKGKEFYHFEVVGKNPFETVYEAVFPFIGTIKQAQAQKIFILT